MADAWRMNTGQIISGIAHLGLIAWVIQGGAFRSEPLPYEVVEVTAISAEDYAALVAPESAPEATAVVDTPEPPSPGAPPELDPRVDEAPAMTRPEAAQAPPADAAPEILEPAPPTVEDPGEAPQLLPPSEDVAVLLPEAVPRVRPAPRVAPEPVAPPEPDRRIEEIDREASMPDSSAESVEPEREATAREEAATRIVTEAERLDGAAPARSLRPRLRPAPGRSSEPKAEAAAPAAPAEPPAPLVDKRALRDALTAALGRGGAEPDRPAAGPPLTAAEKDALRIAVRQCWNVGSLSTEALRTTVVVAVEMAEDGRPVSASIRMTGYSGGNEAAARQAFDAARRAILRCGSRGFDLPAEKYDHWREIEMTFNPEKMRIK